MDFMSYIHKQKCDSFDACEAYASDGFIKTMFNSINR
jgi:hypothetical protein